MKFGKKQKDGSRSVVIETTGDELQKIGQMKKYMPTEPSPDRLLITRKLWKKIKKHAPHLGNLLNTSMTNPSPMNDKKHCEKCRAMNVSGLMADIGAGTENAEPYTCLDKSCPCHTPPTEDWRESFVEAGANIEHDRWGRWQKYMFSKGTQNPDGSLTIPKEFVEHWFRQIDTPYSELSEPEKESDRKETRNYLPLIEPIVSATIEKARGEALEIIRDYRNIILRGHSRGSHADDPEDTEPCDCGQDSEKIELQLLANLERRLLAHLESK